MAIINGTSVGGMTLQADYSYTQNTTANTTTVTVILKLAGHYALYASAMSGSYISVGGSKTNYSKTISYGGSTTTTTELTRKTVTVTHSSDGSATCNISGTFVMNGTYRSSSVGTMTVSQTITLPKIARSSGVDKFTDTNGNNLTSTDTGVAFRVYWTPASNTFKYRLQCVSPGGTFTYPSGTTFFEPKSTSSYYTTITSGHNWLPAQTSHRMEVRLYTYNSAGTQVGSTQMGYLTLNVPSHIAPSIGSFIVESVDGMNGLSIRGRSRVRLTANATPGSGASSMATYTFNGNNVNEADGSYSRIVYNPANSSVINTGVLNYTGPATYTVTVADMRGRTASASLGIEVFEYSAPAILSMSVQRCNASGVLDENGTYAYVTVNSRYTTLYHNNTNYNSRTVVLTNNANSYSATVQNTSNTSGSWSGVYGNGTFATGTTYTITATIKDTAYNSTASMSQPLKAAARPMNIKANGKGIGFGKMAETDNLLDVQWNERVRGNLQVDGTITANGVTVSKDTYVLGGSRDNITDENWIAGAPSFIGTYSQNDTWYNTLSLRHRNGQSDGTSYGMQLRSHLVAEDNLSWRQQVNDEWKRWKTILDDNNTVDRIIEWGQVGVWTYRKWNTGAVECWGTISGTLSPYTTINGFSAYEGSVAFPANLFTSSPNVQFQPYIGNGFAIPARGVISTNTQCKWVALSNVNTANTTVKVDVFAIGKWK
jgi:hypothetical protein